ncbi:MAG: helix-turn-helix transcriptional regulator [Lachnospiraceae bacterium]
MIAWHILLCYNETILRRDTMRKDKTGCPQEGYLTSGEVIKKYRLKNNLSRPELAKMMDLSRNTLMNWENDKSCPDTKYVRELVQILGIPFTNCSAFLPRNCLPARKMWSSPVPEAQSDKPETGEADLKQHGGSGNRRAGRFSP